MTALLRPLGGGNGGESAWKVAAGGMAWRGGGAAGPPWAARATLPPAAQHLREDPASSPSAGKEEKTPARGEGSGSGLKNFYAFLRRVTDC